jgi:hypothetical protein
VKRMLFAGLFIFSLAANLAVAVTLGWYYWRPTPAASAETYVEPPFNKKEMKRLHGMWPRKQMLEFRRKIMEKRAEILDEIAANPGNPKAADKSFNELVTLRAEMERKAMAHFSAIMANLPEEKRRAFVAFLKQRQAQKLERGWEHRGTRQQRMGNREMPCQPRLQLEEKPQSPDTEKSSRDFSTPPVNH